MNKKYYLMIALFFILILTILTACGSGPQNELEGSWALDWFSSTSVNLVGDLNFGDGKSLTMTEALTGSTQNLRYAVIAPGKLSITLDDTTLVADYTIEEDSLTIKFDDGRNNYQRAATPDVKENDDLAVWSDPTEIEQAATATQPNMNQIILPTSTLRATSTSAPVVVLQLYSYQDSQQHPYATGLFTAFSMRCLRLHVGDSAYVNYDTGRVWYAF